MEKPSYAVKFEGLDDFLAGLEAKPEKLARAVLQALYREGEELVTEAKRLTPVDTGTLRSSGHARPPEVTDDGAFVEVGFGGPAGAGGNEEEVGYAIYVHEDLTARHPVGQAKFLEAPFNARKATFAKRFADRVRTVMRGR